MTEPTCCPPAPAPRTDAIGGCIRLTNTGPQWHVNTRHTTLDFDTSAPPEIDSKGNIYARLLPTLDVVYTDASPDETLTGLGISAGASGGVSGLTAFMYRDVIENGQIVRKHLDLNDPADYARVRGEYSNIWLIVVRVPGTEAA